MLGRGKGNLLGDVMRFNCRAVELGSLNSAAWRFENVVELDAPPLAVFDVFADGESWPQWFEAVRRVAWTSPEPKGVGATRTVTLRMALLDVTVYERFLAWDPGERFAFRFEGSSLPMLRAGIEDYLLEDLGGSRCRLTYTVLLEPTTAARLAGPIARPMFANMLRTGVHGLQEYIANQPRR